MTYRYKLTQRRKGARKKRRFIFALACCLILTVAQLAQAQARRGMMAADVLRVAGVGDAQISPDGEWVVYTVSTVDRDAARTTLWIARPSWTARTPLQTPTTGRPPVPLLSNEWSGSNPRWSPDGKRIAFLSAREGQAGIYVVSLAERQPRFVAAVRDANFFITYAGESFAWSPDSRRIAFINAVEDESDSQPLSAATTRTEKPNDPRVIDRIQYKTRTSFSDRARTHVWLVEVDAPAERMQPRQLTAGPSYDHALSWNPQGGEIAFLSNHELDPEANNNSDIFAVDLQGRVRQLTTTPGCEYEPQWSPDGKWIAYTATTRDITTIDSVAEDTHVWLIDAEGGRGRELTAALDRRARSPRWSPGSRSIYFLASDRGQTLLYRIETDGSSGGAWEMFPDSYNPASLAEGRPHAIARRPFQISNFSLAGNQSGLIACTLSNPTEPTEVWLGASGISRAGSRFIGRISAHNDGLTRSLTLVEPTAFSFKSFDGTTVQGWLMKPVGFREGQRYPLILSIHGGPHGMYGYGFNASFQVYAARGYGVLFLNPRGSSGYGQRFADGTLREWGGGDYRDLMLGVDEAVRTRAWIDADRLGVTGGSYGGFMTNWIITQTPRFRAAVASASVSNLVSFYATSLYQDLIHAEFGGFPWDDFDLLWRWSPLRYVKAAQTPTLFLHGEQDNDVHITQAEEMYMALRRRGIETVLVRYPREGHGLREPRHRVDALERTVGWFDKFLK
jgi:dipeptidyl aminopeptidase/acylaminoacyl peptidase